MRVLIAEDDGVSRTILKRAIERLGHECLAAPDGLAAWETYEREPEIDVVISDWMMPGLDGVGLCERIRSENAGREGYPFFIFLTALGDRDHLLEGMRAGADDYLSKPLDRDELAARLGAAERVNALQRQLLGQKRELKRLNAELAEQARRDPLTGLYNRLRLREDLELLRAQVERYQHSYCALLYDVDAFKAYNDLYGHIAGDKVLEMVSEAILGTIRSGDVAYRYGGEEFLVILPEQTLPNAHAAAERLRATVRALSIVHGGSPEGYVTVSCGLAELRPGTNKTVEDLLREADMALYRAKERGGDAVETYDDDDDGVPPEEEEAPGLS